MRSTYPNFFADGADQDRKITPKDATPERFCKVIRASLIHLILDHDYIYVEFHKQLVWGWYYDKDGENRPSQHEALERFKTSLRRYGFEKYEGHFWLGHSITRRIHMGQFPKMTHFLRTLIPNPVPIAGPVPTPIRAATQYAEAIIQPRYFVNTGNLAQHTALDIPEPPSKKLRMDSPENGSSVLEQSWPITGLVPEDDITFQYTQSSVLWDMPDLIWPDSQDEYTKVARNDSPFSSFFTQPIEESRNNPSKEDRNAQIFSI